MKMVNYLVLNSKSEQEGESIYQSPHFFFFRSCFLRLVMKPWSQHSFFFFFLFTGLYTFMYPRRNSQWLFPRLNFNILINLNISLWQMLRPQIRQRPIRNKDVFFFLFFNISDLTKQNFKCLLSIKDSKLW